MLRPQQWATVIAGIVELSACNGADRAEAPAVAHYTPARVDTILRSSPTYEPELRAGFGGLLRAPDGRVYFIDHGATALVRLTPGDTVLARVGQEGGGPGDLGQPCCLVLTPDNASIIVYERTNSRYSVFDASMSFRMSIPIGVSQNGIRTALTAEGWIVHPRNDGRSPGVMATTEIRYYDTLGTQMRLDSIVIPKEMVPVTASFEHERVIMTTSQPYGPVLRDAIGPSGQYAVLNTGTGRIRVRHTDGRWTELQASTEPGPLVTAEERNETLAQMESTLRRLGKAMSDLPFGIPDRKAPLQDIFFDQDGRLWVQRTTNEADPQTADVYDRGGATLLGHFSWPAGVQLSPFAIRGLEAIGSATDDDGYVRIVLVTFEKR